MISVKAVRVTIPFPNRKEILLEGRTFILKMLSWSPKDVWNEKEEKRGQQWQNT